jgi:Curli production assembly/transport component CsgG
MKGIIIKSMVMLVCSALLVLALSIQAATAESKPLTVGVFAFDSAYKVKRHVITDIITANLSADPRFITVERSELTKALTEQAWGLSGNINPETAAKVGQLTGAKILVTGRLFKADKGYAIIAHIIGTETARVYTETVEDSSLSNVTQMASELSQKIAQTISDESTNLVANEGSREDRVTRIVKSVKGEKRPVISMNITERRLGEDLGNLTVETELGLILQKAGFTVVDEKSDRKPDVEITGRALTELGAKRGSLFPCRAIIEVKVRERKTGKILVFDRQASDAVDIGEQTAAQTALETAADELAARLVPLLAQ